MPDIKLLTWSADEKVHDDVPFVWLDAPESTEENPVLLPFTYGAAVKMQVASLDFSEGDMEIGVPEGNLVSELTIKQPEELVPEVIAKGYRVCGIDGKHEGSGPAFKREPVMAEGRYTPSVSGKVTVTHDLGILPDVIIVSGTKTTAASILQLTGYCTDMLGENIGPKQFATVYYLAQILGMTSNTGIESKEASEAGQICNAGPKTFDVGGNTLCHIPGQEYTWRVIGGIIDRSGFFLIRLELDGEGNLLVFDGVPAITQLEIYVDGVYAKTVEYPYSESVQIDISDVAGDFRIYTISVKALGTDLDEQYPYQEYDSVTGWVMTSVADAVAYGDCGENVKWKLTSTGELMIAGNGSMYDFTSGAQPWYEHRDQITSVNVTSGVTTVGGNSFRDHGKIVSVSLPNTLLSIGGSSFMDCSSLPDITIPDSVTVIYSHAFRNCTALTNAVIGNGVKTIELYAFHTCTALKTVVMGSNVETINYRAFQACAALTSIVIPSSVKTMGDNVFYGCSALTSATFEITTGWKVYTSSTATSGTSITSSYLATKSTAATYLRSTYVGRWWKRT